MIKPKYHLRAKKDLGEPEPCVLYKFVLEKSRWIVTSIS